MCILHGVFLWNNLHFCQYQYEISEDIIYYNRIVGIRTMTLYSSISTVSIHSNTAEIHVVTQTALSIIIIFVVLNYFFPKEESIDIII